MTDSDKKPGEDSRPEASARSVTDYGVAVALTVRISPPKDKREHLFQIRMARAGLPRLVSKIEIPVTSGDCVELAQMFSEIANKIRAYEGRRG